MADLRHDPVGFAADVDRVLAHLQARRRSHPDAPATGLHDMPDERWRACIAALRERGYLVATAVCARGDRARNETGYVLTDRFVLNSVRLTRDADQPPRSPTDYRREYADTPAGVSRTTLYDLWEQP